MLLNKQQKEEFGQIQTYFEEAKSTSFNEITKYKNQIIYLKETISTLIKEKQELFEMVTQMNTTEKLKNENKYLETELEKLKNKHYQSCNQIQLQK